MSDLENDCFAFVIMPFSEDFKDIYQLGIKQAAIGCNVKAERLDEQIFNEGMLDRIFRQIDIADFIIADLSNRNANVFYELGYAHAKDKICILLTKDPDDIPFDLKHKRHVVYGNSITYLKEELTKNIEWAKQEAKARSSNKIQISIRDPSADLITTTETAEVSLKLVFDLHNKTERISPDIYAIYLYTGKQWGFSVDGKVCARSESDVQPYKHRYFVPPPSRKLGRDGWAQVQILGKRVVAYAWKGDQIKDEYSITGHGVLRLETSEGNIDHKWTLSTKAQDIPF